LCIRYEANEADELDEDTATGAEEDELETVATSVEEDEDGVTPKALDELETVATGVEEDEDEDEVTPGALDGLEEETEPPGKLLPRDDGEEEEELRANVPVPNKTPTTIPAITTRTANAINKRRPIERLFVSSTSGCDRCLGDTREYAFLVYLLTRLGVG